MKYDVFDRVFTKSHGMGIIVDILGPDYVVDIGRDSREWDTILVGEDEILRRAAFFE